MNPQTSSPLFDLPRELRDMIYTYAFPVKYWSVERKSGKLHPGRGILLACQQSQKEAMELFYKHTKFLFRDEADFFEWMKKTPTVHRNLIKRIKVRLFDGDPDLRAYGHMILKHPELSTERVYRRGMIKKLARAGVVVEKGVLKVELIDVFDDGWWW